MNSTKSADKALLFFVAGFRVQENIVFKNQKILRSAQQKIMVLKKHRIIGTPSWRISRKIQFSKTISILVLVFENMEFLRRARIMI